MTNAKDAESLGIHVWTAGVDGPVPVVDSLSKAGGEEPDAPSMPGSLEISLEASMNDDGEEDDDLHLAAPPPTTLSTLLSTKVARRKKWKNARRASVAKQRRRNGDGQ